MPVRPRHYVRPKELSQAVKLIMESDAAPLGGGTKLLAGDVSVKTVVDLQDLGLNGVDLHNDQLRIGATAKLADLEHNSEISGMAESLLCQAIQLSGPNTFRNAATLGGVIGSREPDSELLALLLTLDTRLVMAGVQTTELPLSKYLSYDTPPKGLIVEIVIPWVDGVGRIQRIARTPADKPIVSVVVWKGKNQPIRVAATGITPLPTRLSVAETPLAAHISDEGIEIALSGAKKSVTHTGDYRGSVKYRQEMVVVLLKRALIEIQQNP